MFDLLNHEWFIVVFWSGNSVNNSTTYKARETFQSYATNLLKHFIFKVHEENFKIFDQVFATSGHLREEHGAQGKELNP